MTESRFGAPRLHVRRLDSTNVRARELAAGGAPDGTLVTATFQQAGRGRQGRSWVAPAGRALLCSAIVREPPRLLPLAAGVAVAETVQALRPPESAAAIWSRAEGGGGAPVALKWPNDVQLHGRKVAGILVEGRPQERWAVVGIGINVAVRPDDFPPDLRATATTMGLGPGDVAAVMRRLMQALDRWLGADEPAVLHAFRARDALIGRRVRWQQAAAAGVDPREGRAAGIDGEGRLLVDTDESDTVALDAGEVHLAGGDR